jgi:hypothetical protein
MPRILRSLPNGVIYWVICLRVHGAADFCGGPIVDGQRNNGMIANRSRLHQIDEMAPSFPRRVNFSSRKHRAIQGAFGMAHVVGCGFAYIVRDSDLGSQRLAEVPGLLQYPTRLGLQSHRNQGWGHKFY